MLGPRAVVAVHALHKCAAALHSQELSFNLHLLLVAMLCEVACIAATLQLLRLRPGCPCTAVLVKDDLESQGALGPGFQWHGKDALLRALCCCVYSGCLACSVRSHSVPGQQTRVNRYRVLIGNGCCNRRLARHNLGHPLLDSTSRGHEGGQPLMRCVVLLWMLAC